MQIQEKNLSLAWIDYKKAFDSVPHSWILKLLELIHVNPLLQKFICRCMKTWNTVMTVNTEAGTINTDTIKINEGIYQGDSLSPLLFCISLIPLSKELQRLNIGYQISESETKIEHLLYMDDLKLFAKNDNEMNILIDTVKVFSTDINMQFGYDKCARVTYNRCRIKQTENMEHLNETNIKNIEPEETYKYLGIEENCGIDHNKMKRTLTKEYIRRVRSVLNTELNAQNKIEAINTLAVPILQYSFGIVDWSKKDLEKLDRKTKKITVQVQNASLSE